MPNYRRKNLTWHGTKLYLGKRLVGEIIQDKTYPSMWRVQLPNGHLTDIVNHTRAKDAALALALTTLHREQNMPVTPSEAA